MSNESSAYYRVPVQTHRQYSIRRGGRLGVTVEQKTAEMTTTDHLGWALLGVLVALAFYTMFGVSFIGMLGVAAAAFFTGHAFNNAVVAHGCDREEAETDE